jgi:hypothetical protein
LYSRFKIDATQSGVLKPYFDIKAIMIALYLLTSSKGSVKAKFIGALYHDYGSRVEDNEKKIATGKH